MYFTLVQWSLESRQWCIEFGDYDRATVESEFEDYRDHGIPRRHLRIVRSNAGQAAIVAAVKALAPARA